MSKTKLTRWDAADELKSDQDCAMYLQAIIEEADGDEKLIAAALGDIARARGMILETAVGRESGPVGERNKRLS